LLNHPPGYGTSDHFHRTCEKQLPAPRNPLDDGWINFHDPASKLPTLTAAACPCEPARLPGSLLSCRIIPFRPLSRPLTLFGMSSSLRRSSLLGRPAFAGKLAAFRRLEPNNLKALSRPLGTVQPTTLLPTAIRVHGCCATRSKS